VSRGRFAYEATCGDGSDTTVGDVPRHPSPTAKRLAAAVGELAEATLGENPTVASKVLAQIAHRVAEIEPRTSVPLATTIAVYRRDSWTCRYCGERTIPIPVLRTLSALYPDDFPHHPNWKAGQYHPAYLLLTTSLDHLHPGGRGRNWLDADNLAAACWPCNTGKSDLTLDELGWTVLDGDEVRSDWDGLTRAYPELWRLAGSPDETYHRRWLRLLTAERNDQSEVGRSPLVPLRR
jgi:5-methylcytosine-specific restriction endonuclease McrA